MDKMNPELKARWIAALRSGEYVQVAEFLETEIPDSPDPENPITGYCCLGVLRHINDPHDTGMADAEYLLSESQLHQFRLTHAIQRDLSRMNDDGKSFAEIADYIEANL